MEGDKEITVTYRLGKTMIQIVPPQITEEERQQRLNEVKKVIISLLSQLDEGTNDPGSL